MVFAELNQQWEAAGLIGPGRRVVDGVHLWAKMARRSFTALMRQGRALIVEAVAEVDAPRAEALGAEFVPEAEADRPVSFDDPDARWGHKAPDKPFCGYKSHQALDPESLIITAVDVVPGNANEATRTDELLAQETTTLSEGAVLIGDGAYNNATTLEQVEQAGARPCFSGLRAQRVSDGFDYDGAADQVVCPEAKRSIGKVRVDNGDLYYFSRRDCQVLCARRAECLSRGERKGTAMPRRRVYLFSAASARCFDKGTPCVMHEALYVSYNTVLC